MIEQITLKNTNISDKSLHLSIQKTYSQKHLYLNLTNEIHTYHAYDLIPIAKETFTSRS